MTNARSIRLAGAGLALCLIFAVACETGPKWAETSSGTLRTVTNRGGNLKLLNLPPKVQDILQITQLFTVFDVLDDEEEAVASFES